MQGQVQAQAQSNTLCTAITHAEANLAVYLYSTVLYLPSPVLSVLRNGVAGFGAQVNECLCLSEKPVCEVLP